MITNILGWLIIIFPVLIILYLLIDAFIMKNKNKQDCDHSIGKQKELNNALFQAVDDGDIEKVKKAIADGADVNVRGFGGKTALMKVAIRTMCDNTSNVSLDAATAEAGKSRDDKTGDRTNLEIAKILVEKGADVNIKDLFDRSAIEYLDRDASDTADQIAVFLREKGSRDFARCSSNEPSS